MICPASCPAELPVGTKPVEFAFPPGTTTVTITAAIPATTASAPAVTAMMTFRDFLGRPCPDDPDDPDGLDVTAGKGAVEESDAYQGPDVLLLPSESFATPSTVLTAQIRGKYICATPGRRTAGHPAARIGQKPCPRPFRLGHGLPLSLRRSP